MAGSKIGRFKGSSCYCKRIFRPGSIRNCPDWKYPERKLLLPFFPPCQMPANAATKYFSCQQRFSFISINPIFNWFIFFWTSSFFLPSHSFHFLHSSYFSLPFYLPVPYPYDQKVLKLLVPHAHPVLIFLLLNRDMPPPLPTLHHSRFCSCTYTVWILCVGRVIPVDSYDKSCEAALEWETWNRGCCFYNVWCKNKPVFAGGGKCA